MASRRRRAAQAPTEPGALRRIAAAAVLGAAAIAMPASGSAEELPAGCYAWPLRLHDGQPAYDGDTLYVTIPGLPPELAALSVRLRGIDTAEAGYRAQCAVERELGARARARLIAALWAARSVVFCDVGWDKYGGRIDAVAIVDGEDIGAALVAEGLARRYDGGARDSWCNQEGDQP